MLRPSPSTPWGTAVGVANKYAAGIGVGYRAVRWDASGTAATELGSLGTNTEGYTLSLAYDINSSGTVAGWAKKYGAAGEDIGLRSVRWDASGTNATELGNLGTDGGRTESKPNAINDAGTIVGWAYKPAHLGPRAVRWDASGTAATELGTLGTDSFGYSSEAYAINSAGIAVGYAHVVGTLGDHAVLWKGDAIATDLNTLIDPASGWILNQARAISDTNWISGTGTFDPDGPGPQAGYSRPFLVQVPEPTGVALLSLGGVMLRRRRCA